MHIYISQYNMFVHTMLLVYIFSVLTIGIGQPNFVIFLKEDYLLHSQLSLIGYSSFVELKPHGLFFSVKFGMFLVSFWFSSHLGGSVDGTS